MLKLLIDGIDRTAWLANGYTFEIEKVLSTERLHLAILDLDSSAGALRIPAGADVLLTRVDEFGADIELLFGGIVDEAIDEPIIDDSGTVTRLRGRDRMYLADQVFVPRQTFARTTARAMFTTIVDTYLGPKGVTINTAPTGGPVVPDLLIEDPVTSVRQALDRLTLNCGHPWRINGELVAGLVEPGSLPGPVTLTDDGATVLTSPPLRWNQQVLTQATRVWVQTAMPEFDRAPVEHTEEWIADGTQAVFAVHVLPTETRGTIAAAATAGDTTLSLAGLIPNASIRIGARLRIDDHPEVYSLAAAATTNGDGEATVSLVDGVIKDVPIGQSLAFLPGAFVQLELDDVVTPMAGSPWVWEPAEHAMVYPGGAPTAGTVVRYRTWLSGPTFIREWDPSVQTAIGWFDYETLVDQRVEEEEGHTDIAAARAFAQGELAKRLTPPKRVTCVTRVPGFYPLLTVTMDFPNRLVTGDYLVTETRIRHSTINENGAEQPLLYELVLMQGDALGESWVQYFRGRNHAQGIKWGPVDVDLYLSQLAVEVFIRDESLRMSQAAVEAFLADDGVALLSQSAVEAFVAVDADARLSQMAVEVFIAS